MQNFMFDNDILTIEIVMMIFVHIYIYKVFHKNSKQRSQDIYNRLNLNKPIKSRKLSS